MIQLDDILKDIEAKTYSAFFFTPGIYTDAVSFIFNSPNKILTAFDLNDLEQCFNEIQHSDAAYCFINYECGFFFEKKLNPLIKKNKTPQATFCLFDNENVNTIKSKDIVFNLPQDDSFDVNNFSLNTTKEKFINDVGEIRKFIAAGDTYQVNYTIKGRFDFKGSCSELFKSMMFNQSAKYSAFINAGDKFIMCSSPELFFEVSGNRIQARPMKGTIKRSNNLSGDFASSMELKNSEKNKAENVMIVDLLRNDLGRISEFGSVKVDSLFEIEKYESLFQMTSSISSTIRPEVKLSDIFKNIFPCGSITGAPKIRTMEIIDQLETESRGLYTGSIGLVTKDKNIFNVVIRTIEIDKAQGKGEIGIGAGIVWDSDPEKEYEETLLKSTFLTEPQNYFELFETMLVKECSIHLLNEHLERLHSACDFFLFDFNEMRIRALCKDITDKCDPQLLYRLKLKLTKWGMINYSIEPFEKYNGEINIILSDKKTDSNSCFQYFKTTDRKLYNEEYLHYQQKGFFDVIFLNEKQKVTEGSITNIFVVKDDTWFTPPLSDGLLDGIYRAYQMNVKGNVIEKSMTLDDLKNSDNLFLTNSLRGLVKVDKLFVKDEVIKIFSK